MKDSLSSEPSKPSNAAHHRRQTMAADLRSRPMQAAGTATAGPVSGLPVHGEVNADPVPLCRPCADQGKENAASEGLGSMAMIWCWKLHRFFRVKSDHPAPLLVVFYSLNHISELGTS